MTRSRRGAVTVAGATVFALIAPAAPVAAAERQTAAGRGGQPIVHDEQITFQKWASYRDWRAGTHQGTVAMPGVRTGITMLRPAGTTDYTDPHTGTTATWEYATWTSPVRDDRLRRHRAGRLLERRHPGRHLDPGRAAGHLHRRRATPLVRDGPLGLRRPGHPADLRGRPGRPVVDDLDRHLRHRRRRRRACCCASYQLRLTLYRAPGQPASPPGLAARRDGLRRPGPVHRRRPAPGASPGARELAVPRYSQNIHKGQYPEYDGGGEAWCSPTSTADGRRVLGPAARPQQDLAWVDPAYADPQVGHAARMTYDYQYEGAATGRSTPPTPPRSGPGRAWSPGCTRWTRWSGSSRPASRW